MEKILYISSGYYHGDGRLYYRHEYNGKLYDLLEDELHEWTEAILFDGGIDTGLRSIRPDSLSKFTVREVGDLNVETGYYTWAYNDPDSDYRKFMSDPANIMHCTECPERLSGCGDVGFPCGQQNCWIELNCE